MFLINALFISSPIFGFLPQIHKNKIVYKPYLSLLNIFVSVIKIFDWFSHPYNNIILIQCIFLILLHMLLIYKNVHRKLDHNNMEMSFVEYCIKRIGICVGILSLLALLKMSFIFSFSAVSLEVYISYLQFLMYRNDPFRPRELFLMWVTGDMIKIYFNIFYYKSPVAYTCAIIIQTVFDLMTILSPNKQSIEMRYASL